MSTSATKKILIASTSDDKLVYEPVAAALTAKGYEVVIYEADKVISGEAELAITVSDNHDLRFSYCGKPLRLDSISAAWYRRPGEFDLKLQDKGTQLSLVDEYRDMQAILWRTVPNEAWLNAPVLMSRAHHKMYQLALARSMGFSIPPTIITNRWKSVQSHLPKDIVMKMSQGSLYVKNEQKVLYTTPLTNTPEKLPMEGSPYPGIFQSRLQKAREWRITVVGQEVFGASIYTSDEAKDDWRKHQFGPRVEFKREEFPQALQDLCVQYLEKLGLTYGAFDFVENDEGHITFLELNSNGQYMWLEMLLDLPISQAIASELARIAG